MSFVAGAILIGAGLAAAGSATTAILAGTNAKRAKEQADKYGQQLADLEANRQELTPEGVGLVDLSGTITNPYANLQVATGAAEFQATQSDIALANTLDLLRATGAGAGGATALAREAAASKQQIAASIEAQEAANARLRAEGEQRRQQLVLGEKGRYQQGLFALTGMQESREQQQLQRLAGLEQGQEFLAQTYQQQMMGAVSGLAGDLGSGLMGFGVGGGFDTTTP
jgi:hypothetical protein